MFRREPLDDKVAEQALPCRTDAALRVDLANDLESLAAHYLKVMLLRDFEELTIAEFAQRLGEQPGAIKSRLHRARELVREDLLGLASSRQSAAWRHRPSLRCAATALPETGPARPSIPARSSPSSRPRSRR